VTERSERLDRATISEAQQVSRRWFFGPTDSSRSLGSLRPGSLGSRAFWALLNPNDVSWPVLVGFERLSNAIPDHRGIFIDGESDRPFKPMRPRD
jgi:hypothetical protein